MHFAAQEKVARKPAEGDVFFGPDGADSLFY
jgi:hypothetical protein